MTIHQYLMSAIQDDAQRAGERDRLHLEARRARRTRRPRRPDPGVPARPLARLLLRWSAAQRAGPLVQESAKTPQSS
jgi:hypothetical protein